MTRQSPALSRSFRVSLGGAGRLAIPAGATQNQGENHGDNGAGEWSHQVHPVMAKVATNQVGRK